MVPTINPKQSLPSTNAPQSLTKQGPPASTSQLKLRLLLGNASGLLLLQLVGAGFKQPHLLLQIGEAFLACLVLIGIIILVRPLLKPAPVQLAPDGPTSPAIITGSDGLGEQVTEIEALIKELHSIIALMNENIVTVYQEADLDTNDLKRASAALAAIIELNFDLKRNLELITASTSDALTFELDHQIEAINEIDLKLGQTSVTLQTVSGRVDELSALMQQLAASGQDLNSQMALIKDKLSRARESIQSNST